MTKQENILMLQLILEDIRGNWSYGVNKRVEVAIELAEELEMATIVSSVEKYRKKLETGGSIDGRYFRKHYVEGGYQNMKELHSLDNVVMDKSTEFKDVAVDVLTCPEVRFRDWDRYIDSKKKVGDIY